MFKVNDLARVRTDNPHGSEVKAGSIGTVLRVVPADAIGEESDAIAVRFPDGQTWHFFEGDLDPIEDAFEALMGAVEWDTSVTALYEAQEPLQGVPTDVVDRHPSPAMEEPFPSPGGAPESAWSGDLDDEDDEDDEDEDECPEEPHTHGPEGIEILTNFLLTDKDGDQLRAIDISEASEGRAATAFRIWSPNVGAHLEVHLTEGQVIALVRFLIQTYGPGRQG